MELITTANLFETPNFDLKKLEKHNAFPSIVVFNNHKYLAFRSAPHHRDSRKSKIVIYSRENLHWNWEKEFTVRGYDCRDPKLVVFDNKLHLYFSLAKANKYSFVPMGVWKSTLSSAGWTKPREVYPKNYFLSQLRVIENTLFFCLYLRSNSQPKKYHIRVDKLSRGIFLKPAFKKLNEEGSECDLFPVEKNRFLLIIRLDHSDEANFGSKVLLINSNGEIIRRTVDRRKFDAPLLFRYQKKYYFLSRQQKAFGGDYHWRSVFLPKSIKHLLLQIAYWLTKKGTAIWHIDPTDLTIHKTLELPSQGDTGYCSVIRQKNYLEIYNYSSKLENIPQSWRRSQTQPTQIYRYEVG